MTRPWWHDSWRAYLHARQLYIETGDPDALVNMLDNVTEHDGRIPDHLEPIAWQTPMIDVAPVEPADMRCY